MCVLRDGMEDPLDDAGLVQQQLDQLSTIGRCEYEKTCALLVQLFDQSAQSYQELLQSNSSSMDAAVQEGESRGRTRNSCCLPAQKTLFLLLLSWVRVYCVFRSLNVVGVHHRRRYRGQGFIRQHRRARRHGRRTCVPVRVFFFISVSYLWQQLVK